MRRGREKLVVKCASDPEAMANLAREYGVLRKLDHEHVVRSRCSAPRCAPPGGRSRAEVRAVDWLEEGGEVGFTMRQTPGSLVFFFPFSFSFLSEMFAFFSSFKNRETSTKAREEHIRRYNLRRGFRSLPGPVAWLHRILQGVLAATAHIHAHGVPHGPRGRPAGGS